MAGVTKAKACNSPPVRIRRPIRGKPSHQKGGSSSRESAKARQPGKKQKTGQHALPSSGFVPLPIHRRARAKVREALIDRIEAAMEEGTLRIGCVALRLLLFVLFPEDFDDPPMPARPTDTPPRSGGPRVDAYAARHDRGEAIWHPDDAEGDQFDKGLRPNYRSRLLIDADGFQQEQGRHSSDGDEIDDD